MSETTPANHQPPKDGRPSRRAAQETTDRAYAIKLQAEEDKNTEVRARSNTNNSRNKNKTTRRRSNTSNNNDTAKQTISKSSRKSGISKAKPSTTSIQNNNFDDGTPSSISGTCTSQHDTPPDTIPNNNKQQTIPSCKSSIASDITSSTTSPISAPNTRRSTKTSNKSLIPKSTLNGGTSTLPSTDKKRSLNGVEKKSTATASSGSGGQVTRRCRTTISTNPQYDQVPTTSSLKYPPSQCNDNNYTSSNKKKLFKEDVGIKESAVAAPDGRRERRQHGSTIDTTSHTIAKQYTSMSKRSAGGIASPLLTLSPNKGIGVGGRGKSSRRRVKRDAVGNGNLQKNLFSSHTQNDNDNGMLGMGHRKKKAHSYIEEGSGDMHFPEESGADEDEEYFPEEPGDKAPPSTRVKAVKKKAPRGKKMKGKSSAKCDMKPPPQQLPIGRDPSRPVEPLPQIDEKLDKALQTYTQSIHRIIERGEVYTLPRHELLDDELRTPATIEEIKSISSDNHWGTASCMVADRLGMKSHHFKEDNHTHKSLQDITQKTVVIRRLRRLIGSEITRVEHAKMILDVAFNHRSTYADGLPHEARALLNQGAPPNHRNSRFHQQNYGTTKELKLMTKRERIHNNGCRPNSCCPLTMNCLIPMYMKELAGDKCLSKFQLTPDDLNQGDNYWFVLDNDDGSQSSFKRIITRQALEFCGCSYLEVILVSQYDLALKHELCLTVYGTPGMTLISSVYATDLKLFDMRMKDMNLYSAVCTLLMLYPHMENLVTERVIVMYDEEHLVKLDECLLYFLGPLLGIDKVLPVISQWRAENMPPGARKELRKMKLALLEKANAVMKETRRAYKAGEELTDKQKKTIAKLEKFLKDTRDLWKRYRNGEVLPIHEEVRISATLDALNIGGIKGRATMDKAREAVKNNTADDDQQDMVARQDEGRQNGLDTQDKARKDVKAGTADDDQQDMIDGQLVGLENGRDTMHKAREAVKDGTADDDQQDMITRIQAGGETKKMIYQVKQLEAAAKADKGVDVVKCNRNDSCGDLLYVKEDSCKTKDFSTAPPRGTIYRIQMSCSCRQHKAYIFEERLSKAATKRLYQEKKEQLEERTAATVQKNKERKKKKRKKKRKSNSETEANEPKKKRKK